MNPIAATNLTRDVNSLFNTFQKQPLEQNLPLPDGFEITTECTRYHEALVVVFHISCTLIRNRFWTFLDSTCHGYCQGHLRAVCHISNHIESLCAIFAPMQGVLWHIGMEQASKRCWCRRRPWISKFPRNILVRAHDAFVDALDCRELGIELDAPKAGNSEYDPRCMPTVCGAVIMACRTK